MNITLEKKSATAQHIITREEKSQTVLIVDPSKETRDVLEITLERRGIRTITTALPRQGIELARETHPDVIFIDADSISDVSNPEKAIEEIAGFDTDNPISFVAVGSMQFKVPKGDSEFLSKPYHFAPLLQKIELLLKSMENKTQK